MKSVFRVRDSFRSAILVTLVGFFSESVIWAGASGIECMDHGNSIPVNNSQVISWKSTTPNQFLARAHVEGVIAKIFPDRSGHNHFEIKIGSKPKDTLEVIYNVKFGDLPYLQSGMRVEACGDYITSVAQAGPYPPSPSGAIIHWVHTNPSGRGHDSGFLIIDGVAYGQEIPIDEYGKRRNGRKHADSY